MNNCSFVGRVGRDSETRFTPGGKPVTSWSLAVDSGFGESKQTIWLDCSLWGERGEKLAEYIKKGSLLGVTGELGQREHEGKTYLKLNVRDVKLCGSKPEGSAKPARGTQHAPDHGKPTLEDDAIPFSPRGKRSHWE